MSSATTHRSGQSRAVAIVCLAVAGAMMLTGCKNDRALGARPADQEGSRAVTPATTAPASPAAPVEATNLELPRTISYVGVEYTITKVTLHAADPLYGNDGGGLYDPTRGVLVTMEAKNTNQEDLRLPKAELITGTQAQAAAVEMERRDASDMLAGSSTMAVRAYFLTDLADVSGSSFSIKEEGRVPVTIPLTGAIPATGYPVKGKVGPGLGAVGVSTGGSNTMNIDVTGAQIGLDSLPVYPERAETGYRFVVLSGKIKIANSPLGTPGYFTFGSDIRVLADELATAPTQCTGDPYGTSIMVQVGEVAEFSCSFPVKDSATEFAVSTGFANAKQGKVRSAPIVVGTLPPISTPAATAPAASAT